MKSLEEKFEKDSIRFIDRLYRDLYLSEDVLRHSTHHRTDKFNNIREYLKMLESMHDRVLKSNNRKELIKRLYHDKYVIRYEDIPDSYYETFIKMNLDRGYGALDIDDIDKEELSTIIIEDQKKSLDDWLDYFLSEKSSAYPFWVKYWAFQGLLRLGKYNKSTGTYNRRTFDTLAPFVELNAEALALSMDLIIKTVKKEKIDDKELKKLAASGSFEKIYLHELNSLLKNKNEVKRNEGKWVRYKKGSDYLVLVNSLRGYNTGWCTAGEESAKTQLSCNDFDVYYTLDSNNEYKVPRIAILHDDSLIREIRGIEEEQAIEPEMLAIAKARANLIFPYNNYFEIEDNTRKLTEIYYKQINHVELTDEELKFIYNANSRDFFYKDDERVDYIKGERDKRTDLARVYGCSIDEVALNKEEFNSKTKVYVGNWNKSFDSLNLPDVVIGDVDLSYLKTTEGLKLPRIVIGSLHLWGLTEANGLVLPEVVTNSLDLDNVEEANGMILPKVVGDLTLWSLKRIKGLKFPEVLGSLFLREAKDLDGLVLPQKMRGFIHFRLDKNVSGMTFPKVLSESLDIDEIVSIENVLFPEYVFGNVSFSKLKYAKNGVLPRIVGGNLDFSELTMAENVVFPEEVYDCVFLASLVNVKNVSLPKCVRDSLYLNSLINGDGLVLPSVIYGHLILNSLIDLNSIVLPDEVHGIVYYGDKEISLEELKQLKENNLDVESKTK